MVIFLGLLVWLLVGIVFAFLTDRLVCNSKYIEYRGITKGEVLYLSLTGILMLFCYLFYVVIHLKGKCGLLIDYPLWFKELSVWFDEPVTRVSNKEEDKDE